MRKWLMALCFCAGVFSILPALSDEIFRIEVGRDYSKYSERDLKRRVWQLERAVDQLQTRIFHLEAKPVAAPPADTWACTLRAMGGAYTGTGPTKAVASARAIENCKAGQKGDGFFCKNPQCEQ